MLVARKRPAPEGALRRQDHLLFQVLSFLVRKRPAPEGALRPSWCSRTAATGIRVRKRPAPEGALRREDLVLLLVPLDVPERNLAPEGALRPESPLRPCWRSLSSESIQHQKVHEGIYRHAPGHRMPIFTLVRQHLDILPSRPSSRSHP